MGFNGVRGADELKDVEKWHSVETNDYELDRMYLHEPSPSYPFGIWVDSFSGIERICWRCGDRTITWVVYSHMDHTYLRLCHVDLYEYSNAGFIKPRKNGSIGTKGSEFTITSCPTKFSRKDKEIFGA